MRDDMKEKKLNSTLLIVIGIVLVVVLACLYFFDAFAKDNYCTEITFEQLEEKMNNKDTFIIFFGSTICSHCKDFQPTLNRVIKEYDIIIYYLNVHNLTDEEHSDLLALINYGSSTPKLYFVEEGEYSQYNALSGNRSYNEVVEKLEKNGYIK